METDFRAERVIPAENHYEHSRGSGIARTLMVLALLVTVAGGVVYNGYDFGYVRALLAQIGIGKPAHDFTKLYARFGVAELPLAVESASRVNNNLLILESQSCDREAIYAASEEAYLLGSKRWSADVLLNFHKRCIDSSGELRLAADHYNSIGDYQQGLQLGQELVLLDPSNGWFWYTKGQAERGMGAKTAAINSYKRTIQLTTPKTTIGRWVFDELAQLYRDTNQQCLADHTLLDYVAIDPARASENGIAGTDLREFPCTTSTKTVAVSPNSGGSINQRLFDEVMSAR